MIDANKTLTHIYPAFNEVTRKTSYQAETIANCSWFRTQIQSLENGIVKFGDIIKVRIPTYGKEEIPTINKGDLLINGAVENIENLTIAQIRKQYPDSMEVQSITYNLQATPYSQHIRVSGI